jgi:hypothetical protein
MSGSTCSCGGAFRWNHGPAARLTEPSPLHGTALLQRRHLQTIQANKQASAGARRAAPASTVAVSEVTEVPAVPIRTTRPLRSPLCFRRANLVHTAAVETAATFQRSRNVSHNYSSYTLAMQLRSHGISSPPGLAALRSRGSRCAHCGCRRYMGLPHVAHAHASAPRRHPADTASRKPLKNSYTLARPNC